MKNLLFVLSGLLTVLYFSCQDNSIESPEFNSQDEANFIELRGYNIDTTYFETSNYTVHSQTSNSIRLILSSGSFEWQDNSDAGNWTGLSSGSSVEITCTCIEGGGVCYIVFDVTGSPKTYTCDENEGCSNCEMKVVITDGLVSNTVYNGIAIR